MFKFINLTVCFFCCIFSSSPVIIAAQDVVVTEVDDLEPAPAPSSVIRAGEIADIRTLRSQSKILGTSLNHGRFVEQDGGNLVCKDINLDVLGTIATPVIAGKTLYGSKVISERFIRLTFGVACERIQKIQTEDTNHEEWYTDREYLIWDLTPGAGVTATFKVESPEFTSVYLLLNDLNNPERIFAHEIGYTVEGDDKGSARHRFYNLLTRSFLEPVVFGFSPITTTFYTVNDEHGNPIPRYAVQHSAGEQRFNTVVEHGGRLVLQNVLFSTQGLGQYEIDVEEGHLILYKPGPDGLVIPYIVDLKRKRPTEVCLLSEAEIDDLRSDAYEVNVTQGVVNYTKHFDRREVVLHPLPGKEVGPKGRLLMELYGTLYPKYSNLQRTRTFEEILGLINQDLLPETCKIIQRFPDAFSPREREMIARFFDSKFPIYSIQKSPINMLARRIRPTESAVLRTANDQFDMPMYLSLPERPNRDGWFVIDVHGGPHAREFNELDMMAQFWTSRGLPHFRLNIRGSTGFGADYAKASDGKWWDVVDDIGAAIELVRKKGLAMNPIVTGASFGGYAAAAAFAKGYTKHAIAINGLYDLERNLAGIKAGRTKYSQHDLSDPRVQFGDTGAIRLANSVTTHLSPSDGEMLIFAGLKDDNCLPEQSQILFDRMKELGNSARLVTMAEEGHSPSKPENLLMMLRVQEEFVRRITSAPCESGGYATIATTPGAASFETRAAMGYGPGALVVYNGL